jgi:hypothetical protein
MKPPKTRAGNTWTEAKFWGFLRSALRRASTRWPGKSQARVAVRRPYCGPLSRVKWEYQCVTCKQWLPEKETELDHIEACGSLKEYSDLPGFVERLFVEKDGYQVLCKKCHNNKTHSK